VIWVGVEVPSLPVIYARQLPDLSLCVLRGGKSPAAVDDMKKQFLVLLFILFCLILTYDLAFHSYIKGAFHREYKGDITTRTDFNSYNDSFLNWYHRGVYSHNLDYLPAYVGRMPAYPFFIGLHYVLFGPNWYTKIIPYTQIVIHAISVLYMFLLLYEKTGNRKFSFSFSLLYGFLPFVVNFNSWGQGESLSTALVVMLSYYLFSLRHANRYRTFILIGVLISIVVFLRPYLAVLIPLFYVFYFTFKDELISLKWKNLVVFTLALSLFFLPWIVRNYIVFGKFIPLKGIDAGYLAGYLQYETDDFLSVLKWSHAVTVIPFTENYTARIVLDNTPADAYSQLQNLIHLDSEEKAILWQALVLMDRCGYHKNPDRIKLVNKLLISDNCNTAIKKNFEFLLDYYKKKYPLRYFFINPIKRIFWYMFNTRSYLILYYTFRDDALTLFQRLLKLSFWGVNFFIVAGGFLEGILMCVNSKDWKKNMSWVLLFLGVLINIVYISCVYPYNANYRFFLQNIPVLFILMSFFVYRVHPYFMAYFTQKIEQSLPDGR